MSTFGNIAGTGMINNEWSLALTVTLLSSYKLNMKQIMAAMSRISREGDESPDLFWSFHCRTQRL